MFQRNQAEQRHFIRHPICFPLHYRVVRGGDSKYAREGNSTTLNIGRGGLLFNTKYPVDPHAEITVQLPFQDKVFKVRAKVVHCEKASEADLYTIGVRFQRMSDAFRVRLVEQMYCISEYRDLQRLKSGKEFSLQEASQEWIKRYSERFKKLYW